MAKILVLGAGFLETNSISKHVERVALKAPAERIGSFAFVREGHALVVDVGVKARTSELDIDAGKVVLVDSEARPASSALHG